MNPKDYFAKNGIKEGESVTFTVENMSAYIGPTVGVLRATKDGIFYIESEISGGRKHSTYINTYLGAPLRSIKLEER